MRQALWHLGFFLLKQKQYDCGHLVLLGEGTAAQARGPGSQEGRPRALWWCRSKFKREPGTGVREEVGDRPRFPLQAATFPSVGDSYINEGFQTTGNGPGEALVKWNELL